MSRSVLVVGYGNASRRDDGVAFHIVRRLRARLALPCQDPDGDGDEGTNGPLVTICTHQLGPELAEDLAGHNAVVFVDAHVAGEGRDPVQWCEIIPAYRPAVVSHQVKPETLLALCQALYGRCPKGCTLSVLGTDFDFGEELSAPTSALADEAVEWLVAWLRSEGIEAA